VSASLRIRGSPSGNFTLTFNGLSTQNIPYSSNGPTLASAIQGALDALLGSGNTLVQNFGDPNVITIKFQNALGHRNVPVMSVSAMRMPRGVMPWSTCRRSSRKPASRLAKKILEDYWSFHPTTASGSGLHRFDGKLGVYTNASLKAFAARIHRYLGALDRIAKADGLSPKARLELGVLQGMMRTELSELEDQRLPKTLPFYHLVRLSIVNYLLRNYAPFDRRLRSAGQLQSQVPRYLKDLRATTDQRLADTFYEVGEQVAAGILDAYARELPEHLAKLPAVFVAVGFPGLLPYRKLYVSRHDIRLPFQEYLHNLFKCFHKVADFNYFNFLRAVISKFCVTSRPDRSGRSAQLPTLRRASRYSCFLSLASFTRRNPGHGSSVLSRGNTLPRPRTSRADQRCPTSGQVPPNLRGQNCDEPT